MKGGFLDPVKRFFFRAFEQITEINKKYAEPQIRMSRSVKFALVMLRIYLFFMVVLLFYKFIITVMKR
jgi:hypothetical protein